MALFLTITLLVSSFGLVLLLALKRYELRTGHLFLAAVRPRAGGVAHAGVMFFEQALPSLMLRSLTRLVSGMRVAAKTTLARSILLFEHALQRMLLFVRDTTGPAQQGGPASAFLREVADHKRKLLEEKLDKRAIFDD